MRIIKDGEEVEHELIGHVRTEDEEVRGRGKKKDNKASEQIEAEESLEEESPRRGYPEDTVIPIAIRYYFSFECLVSPPFSGRDVE